VFRNLYVYRNLYAYILYKIDVYYVYVCPSVFVCVFLSAPLKLCSLLCRLWRWALNLPPHRPVSRSWVEVEAGKPAPLGRTEHSAVAIGADTLIVFGGSAASGPLNDIYEFKSVLAWYWH
jgi:hypothetical protein